MRIQLPLFGRQIPIDIDEAKIPGLIDQFLPVVAKGMGQAKSMGIDMTPLIQKMIGGIAVPTPPEPVKVEAPAAAPQAPAAAPAVALPPEGSVLDHTGQVVSLAAILEAVRKAQEQQAPQAQPVAQVKPECMNCLFSNPITKMPEPLICGACAGDPARPKFRGR